MRSTRSILLVFPLALIGGTLSAEPARGQDPEIRTEVYAVAPTRDGDVELAMDLYLPRDRPAKGAVVLMHGGSFVTGSRDLDENVDYGRALAGRGYVAAAITYRLHGDGPVVDGWAAAYSRRAGAIDDPRLRGAVERFGPGWLDAIAAAAVDLRSAVGRLRDRADELGYDPDDIALFGASAGAITALTNAYVLDAYGETNLDVAGVIDLRGFLLAPPGGGNPFEAGDPPLLLLHGEADERVPLPDAESVFDLAREAGLAVELHTAPGFGHELGGAALLDLRLDESTTVLDRIDAFLRSAFAGEVPPGRALRGRLSTPDDPDDDGAEAPMDDDAEAMDDAAEARFRSDLEAAVEALIGEVEEADDFVPSLYGISKPGLLVRDLDDAARRDWSYWPRERAGLPLSHMTATEREGTHRVLSTLLSAKGYLQVTHVMCLEEVLAGLETAGFVRGPDEYAITIFGRPSEGSPWGLRFEGHHVSLNVTLTPESVSVTPAFLGAAPAPVPTGPRAGFDPLAHERRHAFALLASLDEDQRAAAVLSEEPPAEILSTQFQVDEGDWDRWRERLSRDGADASTFDADQRRILKALLREIVGTYPPEIALPRLDALDADALAFAWMGATELGRPHYFRIQGETFVFELDAAQGDGTHVHTVWRDRRDDFGGDALAEHHRARPHASGP